MILGGHGAGGQVVAARLAPLQGFAPVAVAAGDRLVEGVPGPGPGKACQHVPGVGDDLRAGRIQFLKGQVIGVQQLEFDTGP